MYHWKYEVDFCQKRNKQIKPSKENALNASNEQSEVTSTRIKWILISFLLSLFCAYFAQNEAEALWSRTAFGSIGIIFLVLGVTGVIMVGKTPKKPDSLPESQ